MRLSTNLKNARAALLSSTIGPNPRLVFCSGPEPASCADPESGIRLAVIDLPEIWVTDPVDGALNQVGVWSQPAAQAGGIPGYFRIYDAAGICHVQDTVGRGITGTPAANITLGGICSVVAWSWDENQI